MEISEIKKISFDIPYVVRPWIDPEDVTGIDHKASKEFYKNIWNSPPSPNPEQYDPVCDTKILFTYIDDNVNAWSFGKKQIDEMPEELIDLNALKITKAGVFFIRCLGYYLGGQSLINKAKFYSDITMNKLIYNLLRDAFEKETEPYLKWTLQDCFLEFFGYLPVYDTAASINWNGLSEEDLRYIKYLNAHRMNVPYHYSSKHVARTTM
jgi:hypothetical protein